MHNPIEMEMVEGPMLQDSDDESETPITDSHSPIIPRPNMFKRMLGLGESVWITVEGKNPKVKYTGKIRNYLDDNTTATRYVAFRGIPYGVPPLKHKRFQPPELIGSKSTHWDAFATKKPCLQRNRFDKEVGSEDCLHLDIYMPREPEKILEPLPVLVFFHGGEFSAEERSLRRLSPDSIMKQDLIFVTVSYRLGPFGFLNMQTKSCRGNTGLKDQVLALKWIQDNIEEFKGDPGNVTISGHGAGATCVNFHLISPLSKDLFHKAIVSAGGIYCPWGFKGHQSEFKEIFKQASVEEDESGAENEGTGTASSATGSGTKGGETGSGASQRGSRDETRANNDDEITEDEKNSLEYKAKELVTECFMKLPCDELERIANLILDDYTEDDKPTELTTYLGPSVEVYEEDAFLPGKISTLLKNAKQVPILAGITKHEGSQIYEAQTTSELVNLAKRDNQLRSLVMQYFRIEREDFYKEVKNLYLKNVNQMSDQNIEECLVNMHTDIAHRRFYENFQFGEPLDFPESLFVYEFTYHDDLNKLWHKKIHKNLRDHQTVAGHGDELLYLFCPRNLRAKLGHLNEGIEHVMNNMCSMWANFCKHGIPKSNEDVEWKPHRKEEPFYMEISRNLSLKEGTLNSVRWSRFESLCKPEPVIKSLEEEPPPPALPILFAHMANEDEVDPITFSVIHDPILGSSLVPNEKKPSRRGSKASTTASDPDETHWIAAAFQRMYRSYSGAPSTEGTSPSSPMSGTRSARSRATMSKQASTTSSESRPPMSKQASTTSSESRPPMSKQESTTSGESQPSHSKHSIVGKFKDTHKEGESSRKSSTTSTPSSPSHADSPSERASALDETETIYTPTMMRRLWSSIRHPFGIRSRTSRSDV